MLAALYSGGKDSTLAIHMMFDSGMRVELLITLVSDNDFSYMFHKPNVMHTALQAEAMGIRQKVYHTKGEKEKELKDLEDALKENSVTGLVTGAVASNYQRERVERLCAKLGITHHGPLWGIEPLVELNELSSKYNVIISQVAAAGFDDSMLGARLDASMIEKLKRIHRKYRINMLFEGGEAESFVLDAPLFTKRIIVTESHKIWKGMVGQYVIDRAELVEK